MNPIRTIITAFTGFLAALSIAACGTAAEPVVTMQATILQCSENSLLLEPIEPNSSSDRFSTSVAGIPIVGRDRTEMQPADLKAGQTVEVEYDGYIRESYPAGITCSRLTVTGSQPDGWVNPIEGDDFFSAERDPDSPYGNMPSLGVEYNTGETVSYTRTAAGTASWCEDDFGICVDSILPVSSDSRELIPVISREKGYDSLMLLFSQEPDSFTVRCWDWEEFAETWLETDAIPVETDVSALTIPKKDTALLLEIQAEWEQGTVLYYFTIE